MRKMETKEQVQQELSNIKSLYLPRYLYKLDTHSMKVFNTYSDIEYMYEVIKKVADRSNLVLTHKVTDLYESSISREVAERDDSLLRVYLMQEQYTNIQFNNYVRLYILLKDLLKHIDDDFRLERNFYNNTYFMNKEEQILHAKLGRRKK